MPSYDDSPLNPSEPVTKAPRRQSAVAVIPVGEPHRGVMILVLGLFSLLVPPLGFWVVPMGERDLNKMANGQMHQHDGGCTLLGTLLGKVAMFLCLVWIVVLCIWAVIPAKPTPVQPPSYSRPF